jgi:hypothetical protein
MNQASIMYVGMRTKMEILVEFSCTREIVVRHDIKPVSSVSSCGELSAHCASYPTELRSGPINYDGEGFILPYS